MKNEEVKEVKRMKGSKIESMIKQVIWKNEEFKNSYFWTPPANARDRRSYEKENSISEFKFEYQGKKYRVSVDVSCSCKNVYYKQYIFVDDEAKNIKTLKSLVS